MKTLTLSYSFRRVYMFIISLDLQFPTDALFILDCSLDNILVALKVVSAIFLPVCLLGLNESTCETKKNVF